MNKIIVNALKIATNNLRSCYQDHGIQTGSRGVYWSWDSFYASLGSLEIGDTDIVKKNLKLYLKYQHKNGNIPKRIAHPLYALKYLGLPIDENFKKQRPNYRSPYYTGLSISQCPMFLISFYAYIKKTSDNNFLKLNYNSLKKIISFAQKHSYKNGLLKESIGGGWSESVLKRGAIAYTNVCWVEALKSLSKMAKLLNKSSDVTYYDILYCNTLDSLNRVLWHPDKNGYYSDWYGLIRHHHFASDANLLAVLWQIADKQQSHSINKHINILLRESSLPLPVSHHRYYFWQIALFNFIGGLKLYHSRFSWLWLGSLAAITKYHRGEKATAIKILSKIAKIIVQHGSVFEIYHNGSPYRSFFYKSENPWAWSAGMFIYACKVIGYKIK